MAVYAGPDIVENGLVLCLDAANPRSYPGSGVTWGDLCQNNKAILLNGVLFSTSNFGNFYFDGTDDYVQYNGSFSVNEATFICWIKRSSFQAGYDGIIISRSATTNGMFFDGSGVGLGYVWNNQVNTYEWNSGLVTPDSKWCMVAISVTPTFATAYVNLSSAINSVNHPPVVLDDILLGRDEFSTRYMTGNIAVAQIYNRALSEQEIAQNFNALRGRFNI